MELNLKDNNITDQGVVHLCGALKLMELNLKDKITDQGVAHLCGALKDGNSKTHRVKP